MEAGIGVGAPGQSAAGAWMRPCAMALAIGMALGLSGCGGGGGGGGNVKPSSPSTPPATNPTSPVTPTEYAGGDITVDANTTRVVTDAFGGPVGVAKSGAGTLTLAGNNTYSGATAVNAGGLYINGDQSAATGATTVATGATLGGSGIVGGDVTVASGATLAPGAAGAIGTLTINGNLSLSLGSVLNYDFGEATSTGQPSDLINVKGNLTLAGTLNANMLAGGDLGPGVHRLINYDGSLVDKGLAIASLPSNGWTVQVGVAHQVNLVNLDGMTFNFWDGDAGPKGNNVIDGGNGTWQVGGDNGQWTDASGAVNIVYNDRSFAVFQGTPGTVTVDASHGDVNAAGMQFATDGYHLQGDAIHLVGDADDPTQATIRVGDGIDDGAAYKARIDNVLTGTATLVKTDLGTLQLGGASTYSGGTNIRAGTVEILPGGVPGTGDITLGNANTRFDPPAPTLMIDHGVTLANGIILHQNGIVDNAGALGGTLATAVRDDGTYGFLGPAVRNHDGGTIRGTHAAIELSLADATIDNHTGGLIEGGDVAVAFLNQGTVNNDGAGSIIRSIQGIGVQGASAVHNSNGATISGGTHALDFQFGYGGVINEGAGSLITASAGSAIQFGQTGGVQNLNGATITSPSTAIFLGNGGSVTNGPSSTIQSTGASGGDCTLSSTCAIQVQFSQQSGSTIDGGLVFSNAGTVIGSVEMVSDAMNRVTLSPGSTIQGDLHMGSSWGSSLTLLGVPNTTQLYSQAVTGHTTFSGSITGPNTGTWIIDTDDLTPGSVSMYGGTLQIGNGGTTGWLGQTSFNIYRDATLIFDRSDDVTFTGSIAGTGSEPYNDRLVKAGAGKLTLGLANYMDPSNITIQEGTLQIDNTGDQTPPDISWHPFSGSIVNNAALVFDSAETLVIGSISGTGTVTQEGSGTILLDGHGTYTGGTTINKGSLRTYYALPGDVVVGATGTLGGDSLGSPQLGLPGVAGNLSSAGRVALRGRDAVIGGNFSQASTGTLAVSLGSKLAIGGTATLQGGTLEVTGADDGYVASSHTPVLTATGGLTGTFDRLVKDAGVVFTSSTIHYDGQSAWLDTTGLNVTTAAAGNGVSYTPTTMASAQRVQGAFTQLNAQLATGSSASVPTAFMQAAGQFQQAPSLQAAQASLQSLSGELHAASAAMTFESIDASSRALSDHFDSVLGKATAPGMWTGNLSAGGGMGRTGYDGVGFQLNGWLVGNDRQIGSSGVAGFAFGQSQGQQQLDQSFDHNRSRSTEGMLYAGWLNGNWYTQGRVGFGYFQQDVSRQLLLGTSAQGVSTNYSGNYDVAYGETGMHLNWGASRIIPFVDVQYARIDRDGFAEQGAGGFGLSTNAQTIDRWQGGMGLRAARQWRFAGGQTLDLTASAQLRRTFASHGDAFDASFTGLQQYQPLIGIGLSRYSGVFNVGVDAALSSRTSLKFGYDYQKGQRDESQVVSARMVMAL